MTVYFSQLLSYINPLYDPADQHYQTTLEQEKKAIADNAEVVARHGALQRQFQACYEKIMEKNPGLLQLMNQLRASPVLSDAKEVDLGEKKAQLAILSQVVAFLQSDQELSALKAQLDEISKQNIEKEEEVSALEVELRETNRLLEQFKADLRKRENNLYAVMTQNQNIQNL